MHKFELPWFDASTTIDEPVFAPLIDRAISGIIVHAKKEFRLVHYAQLQGALTQGVKEVGEITGYVPVIAVPEKRTLDLIVPGEFHLKALGSKVAVIYSGSERGARMYLAGNPGYRCNAPEKQAGLPAHYYPPHKRSGSKKCVVIGCPGEVP